MLRYVLTLLFISTHYNSLGLPLASNPTDNRLITRLTALTTTCKNTFIVDQIKSKLQDCDVNVIPPYDSKKIFQCLIFYDINKQLCTAIEKSKLVLNGDYTPKINEKLVTNDFCAVAKDWNYKNIIEYPKYKESAEVVFTKSLNLCPKACGSDEVMSDDSSYFCKYYKWGMDMLKPILTEPTQPAQPQSPQPQSEPSQPHPAAPDSKNPSSSPLPKPEIGAEPKKDLPVSGVPTDTLTKNENNNVQQNNEVVLSSPTTKFVSPKIEIDNMPVLDNNIKANSQKPASDRTPNSQPNVAVDPIETQGKGSPVAESMESGKPLGSLTGQEEAPGKFKQEDTLDYSRDNAETDLDDGEDDTDPKQEMDQSQDAKLKAELPNTLLNLDSSQREFYGNSIGPEGLPEDDDHFFSFFLTVVILVVLLYVLYHNKSKVSKVVLGLIVEGRQSGRRRNSRGHAYRRLDTLEQAMSANTAAPPSKIIY